MSSSSSFPAALLLPFSLSSFPAPSRAGARRGEWPAGDAVRRGARPPPPLLPPEHPRVAHGPPRRGARAGLASEDGGERVAAGSPAPPSHPLLTAATDGACLTGEGGGPLPWRAGGSSLPARRRCSCIPLAGGPCSLCRRAGHDPCLLRARRPPSSSPLARSLPSRHRRLPPVLPVPPSPARGRHGRRVRKGRGRERRRTGDAGSSSSAPPVPGGRSRGGARLVCPATPVVVPGLALSPYSGVAARSLRSGVGWRAASSSTSAAGRRRAAGKEEGGRRR